MDWLEARILTTTAGAEVITAMLMDIGISGAMIEDKRDVAANQRPAGQWDILDEEIERRMGEDVVVRAYFPADLRAQDTAALIEERVRALSAMDLGFDLGKMTCGFSSVDDEDWAESWKARYHPFSLGERFVIKPTWTQYRPKAGERVIEIDPGMAFGTGTHETTALCVALVEAYVKSGDAVLDVGTGSGILAIAAAMVGAKRVLAIDLDPMAVRVARENARLNGYERVIEVREGDLLASVREEADVAVANIIAEVIVMLAEPIRSVLRPGGIFICSGISRERKGEVIEALDAAGYREIDVRDEGEWTAIAARRP